MDDLGGVQELYALDELVEDEAVVGVLEDFLAEWGQGYPMAL